MAVNNVISAQNSLAQAVETQTARVQSVASESATALTLTDSMTVLNGQIDSQTATVLSDSATVTNLQGAVALVQNQIRLENAGNPQTTDLPKDDDWAFLMTLPYALKLGDRTYSNVYVATNGLISFGEPQGWGGNAPAVYVNFRDWWNVDQQTYVRYSTTINSLLVEWNVVPFATHAPGTSTTRMTFDADVNPIDGSWKADISSIGMNGNNTNNPVQVVQYINNQMQSISIPLASGTNSSNFTAHIDNTGYTPYTPLPANTNLAAALTTAQNNLTTAQQTLTAAQAVLSGLMSDKNALQSEINQAQQVLQAAQSNLNTANQQVVYWQGQVETAKSQLDSAIMLVTQAVEAMGSSVSAADSIVQNTLSAEEAVRQAAARAEAQRQLSIAEENASAADAAAARAEAAAQAAQQEAEKAEADRVEAEEAAAQAEAEAQQAEEDRIAAEAAAAEAQAEAEAQQEAEAKAEADRLEAEAEQARQDEEDAKAEAAALEAEAEEARQAEEDAKAEAEAKAQEAEDAKAEAEAAQEEKELKEIIADAKNGKELTEEQKDVVVAALVADLKPGQSISAAEVKASGVSYADLPPETPVAVRTSESGEVLVITAQVAANVELVQDPGALLQAAFTDPGAALAALGSIGADMTPGERKEATNMVVATVIASGAAINAAAVAAGGAAGGSSGGGSSGGGSGANSPGSRGGRRW